MTRKTVAGIYTFVLLFLAVAGFAQPPVKIDHYSTEQGLAHDIIQCMFKDSQGYLWFGTWNGISRFDGNRFVSFTSYSANINNARVEQIVEDSAHQLWIKCYDGQIYRFDKRTETFSALSDLVKISKSLVLPVSFRQRMACFGPIQKKTDCFAQRCFCRQASPSVHQYFPEGK